MNDNEPSMWDEIQSLLNDDERRFEPPDAQDQPLELSPEDREWIGRLVRESCSSRLLTLTPQQAIQQALRAGQAVDVTGVWSQEGRESQTAIRLEPDADRPGQWQLKSDAWPAGWKPLSLLAGRFEFAAFETRSGEIRLPYADSQAGDQGVHRLAACDEDDEFQLAADDGDEIVPFRVGARHTVPPQQDLNNFARGIPGVNWQPDGRLLFTTALASQCDVGFGVVELVDTHSETATPLARRIVPLEGAAEEGRWAGETVLPRPYELEVANVRLTVRPMTIDDVWLLSNRSFSKPPQVIEFLAGQDYQPLALEPVPGGFEFKVHTDDDLLDLQTAWCLQVAVPERTGG